MDKCMANVHVSEVSMDNQKKVLKLIDYIRQICALRQNIVRGIKNEVWSLFVMNCRWTPSGFVRMRQGNGKMVCCWK